VKEALIKEARENKKGFISDVHCLKYKVKKLKMTAKKTAARETREVVSPVEQGVDFSPGSEDRNDPFVISELREEIGAATASADAAKAVASDAKSTVAEDVPGVVDSESIK
jgi:hypothetical protein